MVAFLISAIKIIFLLGFLIFIHEGGHFLIAKACKIKVEEFAIGFGPKIWSKQGKETKYSFRLIPLGGFTGMLGEQKRSNEKGSFSNTSIPKRIAVVLAGGIVNIVFGLLVYFILVSSTGSYISSIVDTVSPDYIMQQVDIRKDDKILKINGKKVRLINDLDKGIQESGGNPIVLTLKRGNEIKNIELAPSLEEIKMIGIYLGSEKDDLTIKIKDIYRDSPAEKVGLKVGDKVLNVNGEETENDSQKIVDLISQSKSENVKIKVERDSKILEFDVNPYIKKVYKIGVTFKIAENNLINNIYYGFWDMVNFSNSIINNIKMLFSGKVRADQLMGPVGISEIVSKTSGIAEFAYILALISLSLGVTNLLPFPPLDGGKIILLLIEAIRKKPIKENTEVAIQMLGFFLLISLSIYVTYNDVLRIF